MNQIKENAGVVIVGAGQAGAEVAASLRQQGYSGTILMLGDEPHVPYRRPPLSKTFLCGDSDIEALYLKPSQAYTKHRIECRTRANVTRIDRASKQVFLEDGSGIGYETLVLATGGRPRRLSIAGAEKTNVHYIRTIDDILSLQQDFKPGANLVIIGGGYIGLEAASAGVKTGLNVTVVEALPRVLARVAAPELSAYFERVHGRHGVNILTDAAVEAFEGDQRVTSVVLADGHKLPVDLVVVGVGLIPNIDLAEQAGLDVSNGVVVGADARTSDPHIFAAGDCTFHKNLFYDRHMRLESVPNATEQGRIVAANICGKVAFHSAVPWFWSDQYDLKLQMVGLSEGYDQLVTRGEPESDSFIAFYLRQGVVLSADAVNRPQDFMFAKRLVAGRVRTTAHQLVSVDSLKSLLDEAVPQ